MGIREIAEADLPAIVAPDRVVAVTVRDPPEASFPQER
jgi:hypothetical protein